MGIPADKLRTGFIAQEVREVIPEAVNERADGYLELNVDPIHWAVVNAVNELGGQNIALKAENARLRAEAENLIASVTFGMSYETRPRCGPRSSRKPFQLYGNGAAVIARCLA